MGTPSRRAVLGAGVAVAGSGLLTACTTGDAGSPAKKSFVTPDGPEVAAAEKRREPGPEKKVKLTATRTPLDLGGPAVTTWTYGDRLPGPEIRVQAGDTLVAEVANHLPTSTSVHWHGLALRNDMDGVPHVTQQPIKAGASFAYRFAVPHPGTYWFHPHTGVQQDRGLYAPLIVEDPKEPLAYDEEWVVVLDDWVDGVDGSTPDAVLAELSRGMGGMNHGAHGSGDGGEMDMPGMSKSPTRNPDTTASGPSRMMMGAKSQLLGGDAGDVNYPHYLLNGRVAEAPTSFRARPGDRIRLRIVNAGSDTAFRVALAGHEMTITHTDGFPVEHARTDSLLLGMGERYDVLVTAKDGAFPLVAEAEGKNATAMAILRTGGGKAPGADVRPKELSGKLLRADRLSAAPDVRLDQRRPDRTVKFELTGGMAEYDWAFNSKPYRPSQRYPVAAGERVRMVFTNSTDMWHPVHIHGHTFAMTDGGPRKDTAVVLPRRTLTVEFDADNPGLWMAHCHNAYHAEAGMMTVFAYEK